MSCLFQSLCTFIHNLDAHQLRQMICNYLQQDPLIMGERFSTWLVALDEGESASSPSFRNIIPHGRGMTDRISVLHNMNVNDRTVQSYVTHMRQPSTWGGAFEIHVFCELFRARVLVFPIGPQFQTVLRDRGNSVAEDAPFIEFLPHNNNNNSSSSSSRRTSLYLTSNSPTIEYPTLSLTYTGNHYEPKRI